MVFSSRVLHKAGFSNPTFVDQMGESLEGAVIGRLDIVRKNASRQFTDAQMIGQTIAAHTFARTRFIAAIAVFEVFFLFAFHDRTPSSD
jgi:hypothetical protein